MLGKANRDGGYDFTSYLLSAKALLNNTNPYTTSTPFPYIYPLFLAFILIPITFLPYVVNNIFWFLINVSSFGLTIFFLLKMFYNNTPSKKIFLIVIFFTTLLIFSPIQNHLLNGQVNFIVLLSCTLFFYFYEKNNTLSNIFLAFAISLKIFPLIFLLFLLIEKKYLNIIWTIAISFFFVIFLPFLFTGDKLIEYYSYYLNNFIFSSVSANSVSDSGSMYFTLSGFISDLFPGIKAFNIYVKIFSVILILSPIMILHYQLKKINYFQKNIIINSLLSLAILLISPSSQTHHLAFIIPAAFWIITNAFEKARTGNKSFIYCYIIIFILFWLGSIFKHTPLLFISLAVMFIIIIISRNNVVAENQ
jgi:hypothetical protein